jgi:hypothetical protein
VSYVWDLGGAIRPGAVVTHTFAVVGEHAVVVTATNSVSAESVGAAVWVEETRHNVFLPLVLQE